MSSELVLLYSLDLDDEPRLYEVPLPYGQGKIRAIWNLLIDYPNLDVRDDDRSYCILTRSDLARQKFWQLAP